MTISRSRTRMACAVLTTAGVLALAACGSSTTGSSASTASPTKGATSAAGTQATPATVAAAFDQVATATKGKQSVKGTLSSTSATGTMEGDFAYKFTDAGLMASFTFDAAGKAFTGILTPKAFYIGGAELGLPGGKKFMKVPLDGDNALSKTYLDLTKNFTDAGDLQSSIEEWKSLGNLKVVGTETVDGVSTTKYTGTIDPANPPASASVEAKKAYAATAKLGITSITTTIWIGPDGLPVKVESKSVGGKGAGTTTIKYTDWGAAVDVAVPPASQVADLSNLLGG